MGSPSQRLRQRIRPPRREALPAYLLLIASVFALYYWNFHLINQVHEEALIVNTAGVSLWEQAVTDELKGAAWALSYEALVDPELIAAIESDGGPGTLSEAFLERHPVAAGFFMFGDGVTILDDSRNTFWPQVAMSMDSILKAGDVAEIPVTQAFHTDGEYYQIIAMPMVTRGRSSAAVAGRGLWIDTRWVEAELLPSTVHRLSGGSEDSGTSHLARLDRVPVEDFAEASNANQGSSANFGSIFQFFEVRLSTPMMPDLESVATRALIFNSIASGLFLSVLIILVTHISRRNQELQLAERRNALVSSASHALRTPLTIISLYAETLSNSDHLNEGDREAATVISRESQQLLHQLEDGMSFARIAAGRQDYQMERVDLNSIVSLTLDRYEAYLRNTGFLVERTVLEDNLPILADRSAVGIVLENILQNAIKYSTSRKFIGIATYREDGICVLEVTDHGVGIERDDQNDIFNEFYRAQTSSDVRGWGLGLFIVKHIVESHGGRVEVISEVGWGTQIRVFLPLAAEAAQKSAKLDLTAQGGNGRAGRRGMPTTGSHDPEVIGTNEALQ